MVSIQVYYFLLSGAKIVFFGVSTKCFRDYSTAFHESYSLYLKRIWCNLNLMLCQVFILTRSLQNADSPGWNPIMKIIVSYVCQSLSFANKPPFKPLNLLHHFLYITCVCGMNFHKPSFLIIAYREIPSRILWINRLCTLVNIHTTQKLTTIFY